MTRVYKTAKGKSIDIDRVKLSNESARAVGNMKVNARGDQLGARGEVAMGRNQVMDQVYATPTSPASYSPNEPTQFIKQQEAANNSKAKELHDLATSLTATTPLEPIVAETTSAQPAPARGSLAGSVAKHVSVNQQPLPLPKKSNGPTRI
jgi:hypothetical protein